ncbi:MAG TPA: TonB-dependent receptor [Steroidobacteraceae bacterium]|jgi:iron complex outermembrane receptor protein
MMFKGNSIRPLPLALLLGSTFLGHSAVSQVLSTPSPSTSDNPEITTIIVTARKLGESIQAIPESITAIDARTLAAAHLTTLDDLNSQVTNLNITQRADNTPDVVLRGVGTFGVVQGVGFYVNDVQQFEGQSVRPMDIERIEVLKGPQGTLFGGSNVGGAIKYVTKLPTDTLTGEGSIEYGRYNQQTVDGVVSGPIVPERLLARLSVFNDRSDGFLPDPTLGKTLPKSNETGGRLTLEYLGDQTKIRFYLAGDHMGSENMNLYYTPPDDHTYLRIYNGGVDGTVPSYRRNLYAPTLAITHDFGDITFDSISSYFHSSITSVANFDKGALAPFDFLPPPLSSYKPFVNYSQDFGKSVWSQELRLSSSGSSSFKWLAGAFVQRINSNALQIQNLGIAPTMGSPVGAIMLAPGLLIPGPVSDVEYRHVNRDYAIFGNASYDWGNWTLGAGVRIARFDNTMTDTTTSCGPCFGRVKGNADVLPTASIAYHFSKDVMAYVTVARGDEEGDLSDNPLTVNEVLPFKTEFALSYEAGVKSSLFDRRLNLNVAAFYIDYTNRIFEVGKYIGTGIFTFETNVGSSRNYGFELDASARLPLDFTVSGGLGVTEAIFGPVTFFDGFGNPVSAGGNQAPNTPAYQATLAVDWRHNLSDDMVLGARVDSRFIGRSYWDSAGCSALAPGCPYEGFRARQTAYQVVNAGVSLDIGKHWSVGAHLMNVFDVKYNTFYAAASEIGSPYNVAGINRPRQWLVNVNARF